MPTIFFVSFKVKYLNDPINGFRFHIVKTDIFSMPLNHSWPLMYFNIIL